MVDCGLAGWGGAVILRWVSGDFDGPILPNYEETPGPEVTYGIQRMDHLVGNVPQLLPAVSGIDYLRAFFRGEMVLEVLFTAIPPSLPGWLQVNYLMRMTGFHEYAEFVSSDVGTVDSGLNSIVLASNNEAVLLPINEPTFGTKRKSQIQTFLEQVPPYINIYIVLVHIYSYHGTYSWVGDRRVEDGEL